MWPIVAFVYANWIARYPEFATVPQATAQLYFNEAQQYCDNSATSQIPSGAPNYTRDTFLNMLTAHIARLALNAANPANGGGVVGRIAQASQGSVSVSTEYEAPGSASWFIQTSYGAAYWQASAAYRTAVYVAPQCYPGQTGPLPYQVPPPFGFPWQW